VGDGGGYGSRSVPAQMREGELLQIRGHLVLQQHLHLHVQLGLGDEAGEGRGPRRQDGTHLCTRGGYEGGRSCRPLL